jgi:hypothetical protein
LIVTDNDLVLFLYLVLIVMKVMYYCMLALIFICLHAVCVDVIVATRPCSLMLLRYIVLCGVLVSRVVPPHNCIAQPSHCLYGGVAFVRFVI